MRLAARNAVNRCLFRFMSDFAFPVIDVLRYKFERIMYLDTVHALAGKVYMGVDVLFAMASVRLRMSI